MATRWSDADVPGLLLLARPLQRRLMGSSAATAEFRLLADRYGLSPLSRTRLRWLIEGAPGALRAVDSPADVVPLRPADE